MKCRNFGKENKLLLFDILDYLVDQGSMNIWKSVSSKKFFTFILDILKTQNDAEIQTKLLQLIQNWGISFQNKKDVVPNFFKIYNKFKMNGVVFPPKEQPNYYNYISKNNSYPQNYKNENIEESKIRNEGNEEDSFEFEENNNDFEYIESIKNKLKISNFESKYRRLVSFLVNMHNNIKTANILIDRRDLSRLKDPINTIKKGNKTIMDTVSSGRLKDEKLMEITLATTEDITQTLSREEELKKGNIPNKFTSSFVLNDIIPIGNKSKTRAKSERKKGILNKRSIYDKTNKNGNKNKDENNMAKTNIKNVDDIFDLFSNTNTNNNIQNNNNNNNMISNYYTNQNVNNQFIDINKVDDMTNYNNSNDFNNYNNNNENENNQINNSNRNFNNNYNTNNNNFNISNPKNKMIDLFQDNPNMNQQNNNFQNQNYNKPKQDEFAMYGPAPKLDSNELVNYMGNFGNNNNNQFNNFNNNQDNNNYNFGNNQPNENNFGNNMGINNNNNNQMTQEEIEREQRLKELDELF